MAPKRPLDADGEHETIKKSRKSTKSALPPKKKFYHVRPENLPDGPWKRKLLRERARANAQSQAQRQYSKVRKKYEEEKAREAAAKAKAKRASTIVIAAPTNDDADQEAKLEEEEQEEEEEELAPKSGSENQDDDGSAESEPESAVSKSHLSATPLDFAPHSEENPSSKPREEDAMPEDSGMHPSRAARLDTKKSFLSKATRIAERKHAEKEARAKERERRVKEREDAVQARNRLRKAKAKAFERGPDGRRKLGRESAVLLEQVKRMVGDKNKVKR